MNYIKSILRLAIQGICTTALAIAMLPSVFTNDLHGQAPGMWNGTSTTSPSPTLNSTFSLDNAIGIGTASPRAWQEIQFCPPLLGTSTPGLTITYDNSCVTLLPPFNPGSYDVIGAPGIGLPPEVNNILFPYSFLTGHHTNALQPLFQPNKHPLFWARVQNSPGFFSYSGPQEFDTKMIILPDGSVGINIADPRAALDVRGSQGPNRPAAIFGSRALGTGGALQNGLFTYYTQQVHFVPVLSNNGYNRISIANDQGMFFTDGKGANGANLNGAFVLAPWSQEGDAALIGGMRMDKFGNVEFHGTVRATQMKVNAKWWSDDVFRPGYRLLTLFELESYIKTHGYLPDVPSEAQILSDGIAVADMFAIHIRKIEELTLYTIEQEKKIQNLENRLKLVEDALLDK